MQIPILNGIYTNEESDFRVAYPRNLIPVPVKTGISNGYLKPYSGIIQNGSGPGINRAGINWNDICYRVMGSKLVSISSDGAVVELGDVGTDGLQATLDYSFDYLGVCSNSSFYLFDGTSLAQVTDPDLGDVFDFIWVDGYFFLTDGEFLIVTELNDPFSVNPLKYGASEADPDPIKALFKIKNEPYVLNRYTIEVFDNVGGTGFPFQRIEGAQIQRGSIGTHSCCLFLDYLAFLGSGRNEALAVWLGTGGSTAKISTREIDLLIEGYSQEVLEQVLLEPKVDKGHNLLFLHLPDKTLVYDANASKETSQPVWFILDSNGSGYRGRDLVRCYNRWLIADTQSSAIGYLTEGTFSQWGVEVNWEFNTIILYNQSNGALFHEIELIGLTGRCDLLVDDFISTSYSLDGETWSQDKYIKAGKTGNRKKRLMWLFQGSMKNWRIQRFQGTTKSKLSFARLEARIEALAR